MAPDLGADAGGGPWPRVGYVLDKFPSLHQTFVLEELLALEELGVGVVVYAFAGATPGQPIHPRTHRLTAPVVAVPPLRRSGSRNPRPPPGGVRKRPGVAR